MAFEMIKKNGAQFRSFGKLLEELRITSNTKSATIAAALSYDVSYISKWVTGKALPSKKNLDKVLDVISNSICHHASSAALSLLMDNFGAHSTDMLKESISDSLRDAYYASTGEINENQYSNNSSLKINPHGMAPLFKDFSETLDPDAPTNIIVLADLFALDRASKLQLAGIDSQHFRITKMRENLNIDYIIDLNSLDGNSIYDVILLIHMMTNYSLCSFRLFCSKSAKGKLLFAVQDNFAAITLLAQNSQFFCTSFTRDMKTVSETYDAIKNMIEPDKRIFLSTGMDNMLRRHEYFHNLLSQNNRWLVGHITEHFLPRDLFDDLSDTFFERGSPEAKEMEQAYLLSVNTLRKKNFRLMLYNLALMDFILSGELDFFNRRVFLTLPQIKKVLVHIRQLLQDSITGGVRLIKEGFSDDFKYITNPCLFLSDATSYLRLENKQYSNNLLLIQDETVKKVFNTFFEKIWAYDEDSIISDRSQIIAKLDGLVETVTEM